MIGNQSKNTMIRPLKRSNKHIEWDRHRESYLQRAQDGIYRDAKKIKTLLDLDDHAPPIADSRICIFMHDLQLKLAYTNDPAWRIKFTKEKGKSSWKLIQNPKSKPTLS